MTLHIFAHGLPDPDGPARPVAGRQFDALSELETLAGVSDRAAFWRRFNHLPPQYRVRRGQEALHRHVHDRIAKGELTPEETPKERALRALKRATTAFIEPSDPTAQPLPDILDALARSADAARDAGATALEIIDASEGLEH
ncbi:hypothetical protein HLH36_18730 [Gluconacetobacter aggeris]|uniref:Uncharacterized protein n=1 Tax=Gluconacetobacter aggeris TaxID=1286186 RepID=A0A7W4NY17_9PROT|nr:hypothetical protein [Gluconacetobacter aggeris]MBB2170352.1 hypothetical protein [Gluconacetobacter aggeris]